MQTITTDFIGIGAAKCGTTWLHHCLEEHPEICLPRPKKEPGFYDNHWEDWAYYAAQFSHRKTEKIIGEFTPGYLISPEVAGRIQTSNPKAKLIFIVRNPIERAYSHYCMLVKSESVKGSPEIIAPGTRMYEDSRYWTHFLRFKERFPKSQILILVQEQMLANPLATLWRIFEFLEVDSSFVPSLAKTRIHSRSNRPKYRNLYKALVKLSDLAHKYRLTGCLFDWMRTRGIGKLYRMLDHGESFKSISPKMRKYLQAEFREEVLSLYEHLETPILEWEKDFPA